MTLEKKASCVQDMATIAGAFLFTEENMVAQFYAKLIGLMVETLVVEFDQQRYEEYLSFGSSGSKPTRHYHQVTANKNEALLSNDSETRINRRFIVR